MTAPDGRQIAYQYDGRGDLVAVTDSIGAKTRFQYAEDRPHFLDTIIDPLGRPAARTTYDAEGRIESMIDADGNTVTYDYDTDTNVQRVTDPLGFTTEIELDDNGNAVREVSPEGVVMLRQYDADNNATRETMVIGLPDSSENGETDDLTISYTYDANGNQTSQTDYRGNVTRTVYSDNGTPTMITDVLGNITRNRIDSRGVLQSTTDSLGNTTSFGYDDDFNLTEVTDPDGVRLANHSYNEFGDITASQPAIGRDTFLAYSIDGDPIASWSFIDDDGDGPGTTRTQVISYTLLDDAARAVWSGRIELPEGEHLSADQIRPETEFAADRIVSSSSTTYDLLGQVTETTDELGLVSRYTYDSRGQQIETRSQSFTEEGDVVWNLSRTAYDSRGNIIASTGSYLEGETRDIRGSQTEYDGDSRATVSRSVTDLEIDILYDTASGLAIGSVVTNVGDVLTETQTIYDSAGRVVETINVDGLRSETTYGPFGDVIRTRNQVPNEKGDLVWMVSHTVYDDFGRAVLSTQRTIEGSGDTVYGTVTSYDELGRNDASQRVEGVVVELVDGNNVVTAPGQVLYETATSYDERGRTDYTIGADGQRVDYVYDAFGRQVATIGAEVEIDGQIVRHRSEVQYNDLGQAATEWSGIAQYSDGTIDRSDARSVSYKYDVRGNVTKTTFADGTFITATYDDLGRKASETNQLGHVRRFAYDAQGQLASVTLPSFTDKEGNLVTPTYQYGYDGQGNQTSLIDPLGRQTEWEFDAQGRQRSRSMPLGMGTDIASGLDASSATPVTERFEYDARGRQTLHVGFEGAVTEMVYNAYSRLSERRFWSDEGSHAANPNSPEEVWTYTRDAYGREIEVTQTDYRSGTPVIRTASKEYDDQGRWITSITPEGRVHYEYDHLGRKTVMRVGDPANPDRSTEYDYDELGRLFSVTERDFIGETNASTPQSAAQTERTAKYFYDLVGNLDGELNGNGVFTDNVYDQLNRLDKMTSYRTDGTDADIADLSDNDVVSEFDYEVREDGRRTRLDEKIEVDGVLQESTRTYDYDDLGRLVRETLDSHFDDSLDHIIDYAFDATGNRVQKSVDNDPIDTNGDGEITTADTAAFDVFTDYTFNAGDQLIEEVVTDATAAVLGTTTHDYDGTQNAGKTEYEPDGNVKSQTRMSYDLQGRLEVTEVSQYSDGVLQSRSRSTYDYDATGIRVAALRQIDADGDGTFESTTDVRFLVDHANPTGYQQVIRESHLDAAGNLIKTIDYTFGHDELHQTVKEIDASTGDITSSRTDFFLHDGHGDVRALLNAAGAVATIAGIEQAFYYDAYGQMVNMAATAAATTLLYSGEQTDVLTGQQYLRARYYNPNTGQFNRLDDFFGNHQDPQSLHKYAYVHGDPITGTDPTGRSLVGQVGAIGIGAVVANIGLTVGQGIYNQQSASAIAANIANNLAVFTLIYGSVVLSGPIAIAAGALLVGVTVKGIYDVGTNWHRMDNANRAFTIGQVLTFLTFARASVARGATGGRTVADSVDPAITEAMRETGLTPAAVDHYFQVLGEPQVFRGTTQGFRGNHPEMNLSPAAIDPIVATAFATEAATTHGGNGMVYYGGMKSFSDTIAVGNYFSRLETEVAIPISTARFAETAPHSITAAQARTILQNMGKNVPEQIHGKSGLTQFLKQNESSRMTPEEIQQFINQANTLSGS